MSLPALERRVNAVRDEYPFTDRYLELPTGRLHYVDEGPRTDEALLFLHGNPTWSFAWRHPIRVLAPNRRCIAPDHVGLGLSSRRRVPLRLAEHVANVEALVAALELSEVTLVLHDWGGAIGMGFARRHPRRVRRIVLANTAAFPSNRMPWRIAACRVPVLGRWAVRRCNAFARAAMFLAVENPLPPQVRRGYLLPYRRPSERDAIAGFVHDIPMDARHPSRSELEATARALPTFADRPILLLWGMRDWCFTPDFLAQWRRLFPHARVRAFPDAGHLVFEDAREEFVAELTRFLDATEG